MLHASASSLAFLTLLGPAVANAAWVRSVPTVTLDNAIVSGIPMGSSSQFLGIPFAQPPTGDLRFRLPQKVSPYETSFSATAHGPACSQQRLNITLPPNLPAETVNYLSGATSDSLTSTGEDCLTLDVVAPANAKPTDNLPVVVWIYGGAFESGSTQLYNGSVIVDRSVSLGVPIIYVGINYRLNAFGFLASKEVRDAGVGNLGLHDQRMALQWVQQYIPAFGGDPKKVTMWGESAGAISATMQMLANGGNPEGLFRAAFMESGSALPVGDITHGQPYYDSLVAATGCSGATDTLQCLRELPYQTLLDAINGPSNITLFQKAVLEWLPRVDGVFLTANPLHLVHQGSVASIPFVSGNCDDEGTLFSLFTPNLTTDAQFEEYVQKYLFPSTSNDTLQQLMLAYPSDPAKGSPFGTDDQNALTPEFKRMASLLGDLIFQASRRYLIDQRSGDHEVWTYLSKRFKTLPYLGATHASDLANVYGGGDMASYLVRFVAHLDPNVGQSTDLYWPSYDDGDSPTMLQFSDGSVPQSLTTDTYRINAMQVLLNELQVNPL